MLKRLVLIPLTLAAVLLLGASPMSLGPGSGADGTGYIPSVLLPDTLLVSVGRQLNVYYDEMSPRFFGTAPQGWLAYADSGRALDRSWRWAPAAAKTQTLTVKPIDVNGLVGAASTMIVKAVSKTAGAVTQNILFIGDSLFDGTSTDTTTSAIVIATTDSLFEADTAAGDLVYLGTQGSGGLVGEGRSGYATTDYTSVGTADRPNPFWDYTNSRVSFRNYITSYAGGQTGPIDYAVIQLGWNDVAAIGSADATATQISAIVAKLDTLVSVLKDPIRGYADCRVFVCTPPMGAASVSAWGTSYVAAPTFKDDWPFWQRNMHRLNQAIIARFDDDGSYSDPRNQVDVIPVHLWVDRTYGYPYSLLAVSARNSATCLQHTNWVHPSAAGQDQEADGIYSALRHGFAMQNPINLLSESELFGTWTMTGSPAWVGWAACTVTDVDSAAGQAWSFGDNTVTYFTKTLTGVTVQDRNTISCYFQRATTGQSYYVELYADLASSLDPYAAFIIRDANPNGMLTSFEALYSGGVYNGANADSSYRWHRCTATPSGWSRISFSFNDSTAAGASMAGEAINAIRVYINYQNTGRTGLTTRITGAQFEQSVRRPSVYVPKP